MPKGIAVANIEAKLKRKFEAKSNVPYTILNKMKMMHGNKPTKKGMQKAHKGMKTAMD